MSRGLRTVLVTGASGFIGRPLVQALLADGWHVVGAGRNAPPIDSPMFEWRYLDLYTDTIPPRLFEGVDALVHGGLLRARAGADGFSINVRATTRLLDAAPETRLSQSIFISSMAAHERALSNYGRPKYEIEGLFRKRGFLNLRPGLVIGNGGLFLALSMYLKKKRLGSADR